MTRGRQQGALPSTAHLRAGAERDSYLASGRRHPDSSAVDLSRSEEMTDRSFTTANPPFPRLQLMQAATDVLDAVRCSFFATAATAFVIATIFVLLFVRI